MAEIGVEQIQVGMIVSEDVVDPNGRVLLKPGVAILDKHINILKTWGVRTVSIEAANDEEESEEDITVDPNMIEAIHEQLDALFQHNNKQHSVIKALMESCQQRLFRRKAG